MRDVAVVSSLKTLSQAKSSSCVSAAKCIRPWELLPLCNISLECTSNA